MRGAFGYTSPILPNDADLQRLVIGVIVAAATGIPIIYGGEVAIGLLCLISFTVGGGLFAYNFPTATVTAWALVALYGRQLIGRVSIGGGVDARPTDPILLGMLAALAFALLLGDRRLRQTLFGPCLVWSILIAWIGFQFVRSLPSYGLVSTLGELRSTFEALLVLPYIVVFVRTKEHQRRLFKALLLLSIVLIVGALHRGALVHGFAVSSTTRWMDAQVNLALVFSMAAWFTARGTGFWKKAGIMYYPLIFATLILVIVCNHRSVWLASAGIIACLTLFRLIPISKAVCLASGLFVAGMTINILAADVNLFEFISTRMTAFTSYEDDPTANWRFQLWSATIEDASSSMFLGKGLGNYFQITLADGRVVTSILHNIYVQIGYQLGLFGLILYVSVIASIFRTLKRAHRQAIDVHTHTLSLYAIGALFGGSLFYVAYGFDPFTWAFVGVGLAAALTQVESIARADKWTWKGSPLERTATRRTHRSLDSHAGTASLGASTRCPGE